MGFDRSYIAGERAAEAHDPRPDRAHETDHPVRELVTEHPIAAVEGALAAAFFFLARRIARR